MYNNIKRGRLTRLKENIKLNTIKIYLAESGRIADLRKDFPLYQGQFQNKLLNVFVPTSILAPMYSIQHYIGQISGATEPIAETLDTFVSEHTYPARGSEIGDVIEWHDTDNNLFYTFVFSDGDTWQKTQVDSFGTLNSIAGTSVKIGMTGVERNGKIYTSKSYFMRYLKTMVYQGTEYALYERKLPKEFTAISGQGTNAPILTINVVNVDTQDNTILSIVTSQTCSLDVMPSTILDQDATIEPTEFESITAQLNTITATLDLKQNKEDALLDTQNDNVVGAINEVNQRSTINTQHIEENRQDIARNRNDIDFLIENMQLSEEYLGQITGATLPTQEQLTNYVQTHEGRVPKSGDVIIFILTISDATDKNYKYYFTAGGWEGYEIPPMESASNDTLGLIEGTYGIGLDYDVLFDISGGQILHIYIKNNLGIYVDLKDYIAELNQDIEDIISGDMPVGEALRAMSDILGNNIATTYLTKQLGATKQYVRDYSLPREFNDVYYLSSDGTKYQKNVSTHTSQITTNAVGDFTLYSAILTNDAEFELSGKNGYSNTIYISADVDTTVSFRMETSHGKSFGTEAPALYATLNVELTPPIQLRAGEIQKITLGSPFLYLEDKVLNVVENDTIKQTFKVITQSSTPTTFTLYSNSTYPTIFNLTTQSYTLSAVEENIGKTIFLGADGIIEAGNVVFTVANHESYEEFLTNQREFILTAHLPLVGSVDDSAAVRITFGDTVYNVYSFMKGGDTPLTFGELKSVLSYDQNIGYNLYLNVIFLETSDYVGFVINPAAITANQLANIIGDTDTIVHSLDDSGTKLQLNLSAAQLFEFSRALKRPLVPSIETKLVAISTSNSQISLSLGENLYIEDDELRAVGPSDSDWTASYQKLTNKPRMDTTNTGRLNPNGSETISGVINLHRVSKTGSLADAIQDSTHRTVTDNEKTTWNNKSDFDGSFSSLTNVPTASEGVAGVIQIATDQEAETGTNTTKAVNPKQLLTAIQGLGNVFDLKGTKATVQDLPSTGNEIGDVWYVVSEQVGYIWLNDGTQDKWEQFGSPIDLSGYVQYVDIINNLTSTSTNKALSAYQGKVLNDLITALQTSVTNLNNNKANTTDLANYLALSGGTMQGDINLSTSRGFSATTTSGNNYDIFRVDSANRNIIVGGTYPALQLKGLNERPTYNDNDIALLSDVTSLSNRVGDLETQVGDISSVLDAINGEVI